MNGDGTRNRDGERGSPEADATDADRLHRFLRTTIRAAGRRYAEAKNAYGEGRTVGRFDLPRDDDGRARIVCRRHVERRAVRVDGEGRPECYDRDHPDCRGCAEDVRAGYVETW